jgi:hypothetical protein
MTAAFVQKQALVKTRTGRLVLVPDDSDGGVGRELRNHAIAKATAFEVPLSEASRLPRVVPMHRMHWVDQRGASAGRPEQSSTISSAA